MNGSRPPRPSRGGSSAWSDGSPARRAGPPCISPSAGPGKPSSIGPGRDCEPFPSQPDGAVGSRPAQQTSQRLSRRLTPSSVRQCHFLHSALLITPAHRHCGPPSSYLCGCRTPPSSLFYWYQGRTVALPLTLILRLIGRIASSRWIWAKANGLVGLARQADLVKKIQVQPQTAQRRHTLTNGVAPALERKHPLRHNAYTSLVMDWFAQPPS